MDARLGTSISEQIKAAYWGTHANAAGHSESSKAAWNVVVPYVQVVSKLGQDSMSLAAEVSPTDGH